MAASFLASFLFFIGMGIYSMYNGMSFSANIATKVFAALVLLANSIFYHVVAAYTEIDQGMKRALKDAGWQEWAVRVLNQCILLSLWFWLDHGWKYFGIAIIALYASFLLWDRLTWKYLKSHTLCILDFVGLLASIVYVIVGKKVILSKSAGQGAAAEEFLLFFGAFLLFYLSLPIVGMILLKFNPLKKGYWVRPGRH